MNKWVNLVSAVQQPVTMHAVHTLLGLGVGFAPFNYNIPKSCLMHKGLDKMANNIFKCPFVKLNQINLYLNSTGNCFQGSNI